MRLKVSMENDENVVKPPSTPMSMPARSTALSLRRSVKSTNSTPIARHPSTLTVSVPYGKPRPANECTQVDIQKRSRLPMAPPMPMARTWVIAVNLSFSPCY
jgi:hypothetical protein